jgi:hypothetical protein
LSLGLHPSASPQPARIDRDRAGLISAVPQERRVSVTRIMRSSTGWSFGPDVEVSVMVERVALAPTDGSPLEGPWPTGCYGLIAQTDDPSWVGQDLVVAAYPYSRGIHDWSRFRRKFSGSSQDRNAHLRRARRDPEGPLLYLRRMHQDLFGSDSKRYTARCIDPQQASLDLVSGRSTAMALVDPWERESTNGPMLRYGLCENVDAARRDIYIGNGAASLLTMAEKGVLRVGASQGLHPAALDRLEKMLELAIELALAGPDDGPRWQGRPVERLVGRIFRDLLGALGKRAARAESKAGESADAVPVRPSMIADLTGDQIEMLMEVAAASARWLEDADECIEVCALVASHPSVARAFPVLISAVAEWEPEPDPLGACARAALEALRR